MQPWTTATTSALLLPVLLVLCQNANLAASFLAPHGSQNQLHYLRQTVSPRTRFSASTISSKTNEEGPRKANDFKARTASTSSSTNQQPSTADAATTSTIATGTTRLRRLKDLVWVRETLEDLTAAEFALSVEAHHDQEVETAQKRRKRAVDYEKLLSQLNRRIQDLGCGFSSVQASSSSPDDKVEPLTCILQPDVGMGTTAYSENQRQLLLERLVHTRQNLMEIIRGYKLDAEEEDLPFSITLPDLRVEIPREVENDNSTGVVLGPKLYVRDDGTVDWDGALQDQAALRKFGGAVWARINGREPEILEGTDNITDAAPAAGGGGHGGGSVTARVIETPEIQSARTELNTLVADLTKMQTEHTALLNSAISAGQAVANVNLASLGPSERSKILKSADALEKMNEKVSYQTLLYELERIYTYLAGELGNPQTNGYISLQDRLNIAEFGLVESQVESFRQQLQLEESIDADVLAVVMEQVNDFKRRLGIDYFVTGFTFDREAISAWLADTLDRTKKGLAFYVKGVRLFWNDIIFCLSLVSRAAQGYTLKPREVRTIRRTFKDILTFIPFVIILIIPLTPVGHVLVFTAIQRFFPEFFPSCFTEQRQNLLQLYENAEYTEFTINESLKEKTSRLVVAFLYVVANGSKSLYTKIVNGMQTSNKNTSGEQ